MVGGKMQLLRLLYFINALLIVRCTEWKTSNVSLLAEELNGSFNFTCILEGDSTKSAITWVTPIERYGHLQQSQYLPKSSGINDFENENIYHTWIPEGWSHSLASDFQFKPITDYRWEKFPVHITSDRKVIVLDNFSKNSYHTNLSFRLQNDGTIYLCNTDAPEHIDSVCFSVYINHTFVSIAFQQNKTLNSASLTPLNENEWTHLRLSYSRKENLSTSLQIRINNQVISCKINDKFSSELRLLVRSNEISHWKLHKYKFISTRKSTGFLQIGGKFKVVANFCISFYISLCPECMLHIKMDYNNTNIYSITEEVNGKFNWKEIKINPTIERSGYVLLNFKANNTNDSSEGFWAVDDFRYCNSNEIRVSTLKFPKDQINHVTKTIPGFIKCQPFNNKPVSISQNKSPDNYKNPTTVGLHSDITCERIFGEGKKFCEKNVICVGNDSNGESSCYCAAGYHGDSCREECDDGFWGFECSNKCGFCRLKKCNVINGTCEIGCQAGFLGSLCNRIPSVNNLRNVTNTGNSIEVEWKPPFENNNTGFLYSVKYKHKRYRGCVRDENADEPFYEYTTKITTLSIPNLLPYSEYNLEVTAKYNEISSETTSITISTSRLETLLHEEAATKVEMLEDTDNGFPLIKWAEPTCSKMKGPITHNITITCQNEWCKGQIIEFSFSMKHITNTVFSQPIHGSIPYTNYSMTFTTMRTSKIDNSDITYRTNFETRKKAPPPVKSLMVYSRNETTISLRWRAPHPPHGILERYIIKYCANAECRKLNISNVVCKLWKGFHCADVTDLKENSMYDIRIQAKNEGVDDYGKENFINRILTQQNASEPVTNVSVKWNTDIPVLHWHHPDITNGPLISFYIEINVNKSEVPNSANINKSIIIEELKKTYSYEMKDLNYSTVYEITIYPINKFKGMPSSSLCVEMFPPTPNFANTPSISCSNLGCTLEISKQADICQSSYVYVLVHSNETLYKGEDIEQLLRKIANSSSPESEWLAVSKELQKNINSVAIVLGDDVKTTTKYGSAWNKPIKNDTMYYHYITVVLENLYLNKTTFSMKHLDISRSKRMTKVFSKETNSSAAYYNLFLLLLLIPIIIGVYILYRKRKNRGPENQSWLPNCIRGNSTPTEIFLSEVPKKKLAVIKPKLLETEDTSPLLQNSEETPILTSRITLDTFEEYVKQSIGENDEDGALVQQHNLFVRGQTKPWNYGMLKQNKYKNRYNNLIAYDHSRVKLEKMNNDEFSDYINANYIDGYTKLKAYIATQGPKPTTVLDFWRMVWQENINTIVMVANVEEDGKRKTEQYWPNLNTSQEYGSVEVYHNHSDVFSNYVFRILTVTKCDEQRTVRHLHFTSWPDHGVPLYPQSLVPFVKKLLTIPQDSAPIIVHCSAGVGRTGTIILCDFILRMAANEGAVDFLATLQQMRNQRANLVDNHNQYKLAHLVVLEALFGLETAMECDNELEEKVNELINSNKLYEQMDYLEQITWQDQAMRSNFTSMINPENKTKNRFSSVIPEGYGHVYLSRFPVNDDNSDYINAVEVDAFQTTGGFIVTQQPLPHTKTDFWRMIHEKNITTVVSLNEIEVQDESSCIFWPQDNELFDLEFIKIEYINKEEYSSHIVIKIALVYKDEKNDESKRTVNIIQMNGWPPLKAIPNNIGALMAIQEEVARLGRGTNPVLVACYDGAKASGVYVALSFVIEKIKLEQLCDVCLAIRIIRHNRKQFVTDAEQFKLLYSLAIEYLKGFETYSNFPTIVKQ